MILVCRIQLGQGSNNNDLFMGQLGLLCKRIWAIQFSSYIDILYTIRSQIECTFRISRFQIHWSNHLGEKWQEVKKRLFAKDKCPPLISPEESNIFLRL